MLRRLHGSRRTMRRASCTSPRARTRWRWQRGVIDGRERGDMVKSTRRAPSRNNYNRGRLCRMAHMKRLLIALVGSLVVLSAHAADARGTVVGKPLAELARLLQARLPALSVD